MTALVHNRGFTLERLIGLYDQGHRRVCWRHDVDFDLVCAVKMAKVEAGLGVRSTFFLRTDEEEYSVEDAAACAARLATYGHQIGVHPNLRLPRDADVSGAILAQVCTESLTELQRWFPEVSRRVALHAPPRSALWRHIFGFDHVMAPCWEGHYIADSRGVFHESPELFLRTHAAPVQINLHPEWWFLPEDEAAKLRQQEAAKP